MQIPTLDSPPHPLILGHRGSPLQAPENTLRSFALALEHGAHGVELDVQRSADGVPVVIHDETLERTTGGRGPVADHGWDALSRLRCGREPLPSLEQAAAWAADAGAWLNVEVKARGVEAAVLEALDRAGVSPRTLLSSFHADVVAELARLLPESAPFLLAERWDERVLRTVARSGARGVCLRVDAAGPLALEVLRREGLPVVVWTVNDAARARGLIRAGVAGLITDRPALAREAAG